MLLPLLTWVLAGTAVVSAAEAEEPDSAEVVADLEQEEDASDEDVAALDALKGPPPEAETLDGAGTPDAVVEELPFVEVDTARLDAEHGAAFVELMVYGSQAREVLIGTVLTSRENLAGSKVVSLEVKQILRGETTGQLIEFVLPRREDLDNPHILQPPIINGYSVLVFLDNDRAVVGGNAMFMVEGGYAWRFKREGLFYRPSVDRVWEGGIDPRPYYTMFSMQEIEDSLDYRRAKKRLRRRSRKNR